MDDVQKERKLGKYMTARLQITETKKTHYWHIRSSGDESLLGVVKWYGRWRQYAFFPMADSLYNADCLSELARFLAQENLDHRLSVRR